MITLEEPGTFTSKMYDVLYWIQVVIYRFIIYFCRLVLAIYYWKKAKIVPPIRNPLLRNSAKTSAEDIRKGKLKSEDLVQAYIARIQEVEPYLNAVVQNRFQEALKEAVEVDELIQSGKYSIQQLEENKPLLGVPFTVKVILKVKGCFSTAGCKLFKDLIAEEDAPSVTLLKKAGGIVIATTNSPEFALGLETNNSVHGRTCNPYNTSRTPGGSSGGESALLAAGASAIGIGNDMGGSVRVPAHFCGLYSHKPTRDLIPNGGTFPDPLNETANYVSTGPMCRYVEDLVTMVKILAAENKESVTFDKKVDFKKLKIFYFKNLRDPRTLPVDREIVDGVHKAIAHFTNLYGATAHELKMPFLDKSNDIFIHLLQAPVENPADFLTLGKVKEFNTCSELFHLMFGNSNFSLGAILFYNIFRFPLNFKSQNIPYYRDVMKKLTKELDDLLDDYSVIFCPTFPETAPYHNELSLVLIAGACYSNFCNFTGMPSTALPMGFNRNGLPQGMQVIGKKNNDPLTIACAVELNKIFGGWTPPGER